ncbi:unnamed protein product [Caenorhabditis nigoni]
MARILQAPEGAGSTTWCESSTWKGTDGRMWIRSFQNQALDYEYHSSKLKRKSDLYQLTKFACLVYLTLPGHN